MNTLEPHIQKIVDTCDQLIQLSKDPNLRYKKTKNGFMYSLEGVHWTHDLTKLIPIYLKRNIKT